MPVSDVTSPTVTQPTVTTTGDVQGPAAPVGSQQTTQIDAGAGSTAQFAELGATLASGPTLEQPKLGPAEMMLLLYTLKKKSSEENLKAAENALVSRRDEKATENEKSLEELKTSLEKQKKSEKTALIGKIFGWIGVAASLIAAAVVTVVTGGAAAAIAIGVAVAMTELMIAQETGLTDMAMEGLSDNAKMGVMIGITSVMLVVSLAPAVMSGGTAAIGMVSKLAGSAAQVASETAEIASAGAEAGATIAETTADAAELAAGGAEVAADLAEVSADVSEVAADVSEVAADLTEVTSDTTELLAEGTSQAAEVGDAAAETSSKGASTFSDTVKAARQSANFQKYGNMARNVAQGTAGAVSIGAGSAGIASGVDQYEATMSQAELKDIKAQLAKLQALDEEDMARIRKMIEAMQANASVVNDVIDTAHETSTRIRTSV